MFDKLPVELIALILEYDGSIKKRNGVYMNQIPKNDTRYDLLKFLPVDSVNNMKIMGELDDLRFLIYDGEDYDADLCIDILQEIRIKYFGFFDHMDGFDHNLNLDLDMWVNHLDNVSDLWSGFYDYSDEYSDEDL